MTSAVARGIPVLIPVSKNASNTAENAGISISEYHVIYEPLNGTRLLPSMVGKVTLEIL